MSIAETGTCISCGGQYDHFGNNPEPLEPYEAGRYCDDCNATKVIPARLGMRVNPRQQSQDHPGGGKTDKLR